MSLYFYEPFSNFNRLFDEAFSTWTNDQAQRQVRGNGIQTILRPRIDLHENTQTNTVTAAFELPGFKKEDVRVEVHDGRLTVSAESQTSSDQKQEGYIIRERKFGKFSRTLQLPQGIKDEEIQAAVENGVLTITFPKSAPEQASKKITIA